MVNETNNTENTMDTTQTIIAQLGGAGRLKAMVAGHNFVRLENGLQFRFKGSRKVNHMVVVLDLATDTYNVEFLKVHGINVKTVAEFSGVYADQLVELFESTTGLYLSL